MILPLITLSLLPIGVLAGSNTANFVVFGDSYSDVGNFQRWTNGPLWSEHVATGWDSTLHSFAYSGAHCHNADITNNFTISYSTPSIEDQLEFYYHQKLNLDPAETVFAFWFGFSDIHQAFKRNPVTPDFTGVIECMMDQIEIAHKAFKASQIMLINLPPMEYMPYFNKDPELAASRKEAVKTVNNNLKEKVTEFRQRYNTLKLDLVDMHHLISDMVHNPTTFGLVNTDRSFWHDCQGNCKKLKLNDYLWWDQAHFTGGVHHSIGNSILEAGIFAPSTTVAELKVERLLMATISNIRSPIYRAVPNTGLLQRMANKTDNSMTYHKGDALTTNTSVEDEQYLSIHWWLSVLVIITILVVVCALICWKKQQNNNGDDHERLLNNEDIP